MDFIVFFVLGYFMAVGFGVRWFIQQRARKREARMSWHELVHERYLSGDLMKEEYESIAKQ